MSQSLTLNLEQEQTAMSFADGKEDFSWLNDDEHLSESAEAIENFENDSNLEEVLGLEGDAKADTVLDDNMIFAKEKQVQHKQEQVTTPSIIVQGVFDGETDLLNGEEKKKEEKDQTDINFETLSATSDVSQEFDGENPEAFELQNDVSINITAEKNANPTAEIVTIDDDDVIELIDENANALHSEDDAGIEDDYDENESERSNEDELSSPQNPLNPGARCILEFDGLKRPMAIRPEVRLYEFMQFLKTDLISQDRYMQEIVLTFRDLQSPDFLLVISQENYYAQQYTMRDMLHLHRNFQRAKTINSTDLLIQMSVQDGFCARLQRVRCAIADATRANSAGNLPQNPIVLDDSNPGTPTHSEIPDNQDDETNHKNAILINSPGEGELVHTPLLGSPKTGNSSIKVSNGAPRNQLLEIEDDDLPPYSDNEREDTERSSHLMGPKEKVLDQYELEETVGTTLDDSLQDTREEYVFEEQPIDLNKVENLEHGDVFKNNGKTNNHDPGDFIKHNDQNGGTEHDRQIDQDLLLENFDNVETISSKNQAETVDDLLPDFEEFEDDEIPLSTNHDTDGNVETFGDVDWTSNDLLTDELESTDLVVDSSISKNGKRNHDMLSENQVDDSSLKKARTT